VRPRIAKSVALLAYLSCAPGHRAERSELLDALFDGRADDSARAYLRQAIHRLREVLPVGTGPTFEGSVLRFDAPVALTSAAARAEALVAEAARLRDEERLAVLRDALAILDGGEYLAGIDARWIAERREQLSALALGARLEAAQAAYASGRARDAVALAETVLAGDPFRESAWRLLMRAAGSLGDEDGVIAAFRGCRTALAEIGAAPSDATCDLLGALRR
jgi:DNA-binding SARP family transcriptional activator